MRLLHEKATAYSVGLLRIWVFTQWIADLVKNPIGPLARIPFAYFEPIGLLQWLPREFWARVHSEPVLEGWRIALLVLLALSALGVPFYRVFALSACVLLTFYQGFILGFAEISHTDLAALYVAYIVAIFPAADALSLGRARTGRFTPSLYPAAMLTATGAFLATYMFVGVRRLLDGGFEIFTNGTILRIVGDRASTPDYLGTPLGLSVLQSPALSFVLSIGFVIVTLFEVLSFLCVISTPFRVAWVVVMLPFHILSWPLLQTLFLHNILLMGVLLVDAEALPRALKERGTSPTKGSVLSLVEK
jgi:hypothetical protein